MKTAMLALLFVGGAVAQQVAAPTPEPVGPTRGDNESDYNIVNSIETGYRWASIGGNLDEYRSQVNYGSGARLLASFFSMNSHDGSRQSLRSDPAHHRGPGQRPLRVRHPPGGEEPPVSF
jgi:hypothetical protein